MRQFNISADSYKGFVGRDVVHARKNQLLKHFEKYKDLDDIEEEYSVFNGHKIKIDKKDLVLLNGTVFKNEMGVVNEVMGNIYKDRRMYKKKMFKAHNDMEELKKDLSKIEEELQNII
jgi:predicted transcriptional regulator